MKAVVCPVCKGKGQICVGVCLITHQPILRDCPECGTCPRAKSPQTTTSHNPT